MNKLFNILIRKNIKKINRIKERIDYQLILIMYIFSIISSIFVYSASRNMNFLYKNIIWIGVGTIIYILILFVDYNLTAKYIIPINIISVFLLAYVRFMGKTKLGAQRWISIFGFQLQPSEFIKIATCFIISYHIVTKLNKSAKNIFQIFYGILPAIPILILIFIQPDLGSVLIILFAYGTILFLSNSNVRPIIYILLAISIMIVPIYQYGLKDYQKTRVQVFLNPESDRQGSGWHITQSKISIGSGNIVGKGILEGSQSRLKFLPEPQTDFIFSVISEETGFVGSTLIILLYFYLLYRLLKISTVIENEYGRYVIYGIIGIFLAHTIVNIGMTLGLVPVTGKPLLLLSYGGSSFISSFCMLGLVQNIKIYDKKGKEK